MYEDLLSYLQSMEDMAGFPIGSKEDISTLSYPPYYTACPNPFVETFIKAYGRVYDPASDDYEKKPFVSDVSAGKNDPVYNAHSYPTKVPPEAIGQYIKHYTEKGDLIFDGFAGTGMTAIAAARNQRNAILNDLSPLATFIAYNYTFPVNTTLFYNEAKRILEEVEKELGFMYETNHIHDDMNLTSSSGSKKGKMIYLVWSDIYLCPYCRNEYVLWDMEEVGDDSLGQCNECGAYLNQKEGQPAWTRVPDALGQTIHEMKQVPVKISYQVGKKRYEKKPDEEDLKIIETIRKREIPYWFPSNAIPSGYNTNQPRKSHNITHVHHFYTKRNLWILSAIKDKIDGVKDPRLRHFLFIWFTSGHSRLHKMNRYIQKHNRHVGPLSGTLYISPFQTEISPFYFLHHKLKVHSNLQIEKSHTLITTQSTTSLHQIRDNTIDYIFTDPPFGDNLMYSELNYIIESWFQVFENNKDEAIINRFQNKDLLKYTSLMEESFKEMYRILKPNRWITVEFHNSKASIWNGIQEALNRAGFIIAQVAVLDKKKGTIKQLSYAGAVKNDLIINAYKPRKEFEERFLRISGEGMEVDFIHEQLLHLPISPTIERTEQMLYSKMLAHYVENGFKIRYNARNFYHLLHDNCVELDGYWFLEEQMGEYDEWKRSREIDELENIKDDSQEIFVNDEKSALTWIYSFLQKPKDYSEILTRYNQLITKSHDLIPELREILQSNFILEDGKYRRPQSRKEKEDIEKNRERELDRAWNKLLTRAKKGGRKIKDIRKEALIHGFTRCYQEERYEDILIVASRIYRTVLESSGEALDFIDIARMKIP